MPYHMCVSRAILPRTGNEVQMGRRRKKISLEAFMAQVNISGELPGLVIDPAKLPKPDIWDERMWIATQDAAEALFSVDGTRRRIVPLDFATKATQDKYIRMARTVILAFYRSLQKQADEEVKNG